MINRLKKLIKSVYVNIRRPEMRVLPGQLAFFFLLTLAPILGLIIAICGKFPFLTDYLSNGINGNVPEVVRQMFAYISPGGVDSNWIIFFITVLFLSSTGTYSMIVASNTIYGVNRTSYIADRIKALIMMMILIVLLLFMILVPVFGDMIISLVFDITKSDLIQGLILAIYGILKYPISILTIFISLKILYTLAPDKKVRSANTTYGAIFTSIMWVIVTYLYSFYIEIASFSTIYGNVTQLIVLMWWIYILAYLFVLGMALNVSNYQLDREEDK